MNLIQVLLKVVAELATERLSKSQLSALVSIVLEVFNVLADELQIREDVINPPLDPPLPLTAATRERLVSITPSDVRTSRNERSGNDSPEYSPGGPDASERSH